MTKEPPVADDDPSEAALATIAQSLRGLRFGEIHIQVHEGKVVQISVTEKLRPPAKRR
jgi:hypothetical protein